MIFGKNLFLLLLIVLMQLLASCVGTIKETKSRTGRAVPAVTTASFAGVDSGGAISHDKIWVKFKPAVGGSGIFAYHAFINAAPETAATLSSNSVVTDDEGYAYITIDNLRYRTAYDVNVKVYDLKELRYDSNSTYISVSTGSSFVPDFYGISSAENVAGSDGLTQLQITWSQALTPEVTSGDPFDPEHTEKPNFR